MKYHVHPSHLSLEKVFGLPQDSFKKLCFFRELAQRAIALWREIQFLGFIFATGKKKLRQMKKLHKSIVRKIRRSGYQDLLNQELATMV